MPDFQTFEVPAGEASTATCTVAAGDIWRFGASGRWTDWYIPCGPEGYKVFLLHVLDIRPLLEDAPWFCVIGRYRGQPGTEFRIGAGVVHRFETAGEIEFLANDHPTLTWNNKGRVNVTAQKLDREPEAPTGLRETWRLIRDTLDRTAGLIFVATLTLLVGAVLAFIPQGQDLVRTVAEGEVGINSQRVWFGIALFLLSMQAWFWLRTIINFNYGSDREQWRPRWFLENVPRVLGLAPALLSLWAMTRSPAANTYFAIAIAGVAVLFFVWVLLRNDAWSRISASRAERTGKPPPRVGRMWVIVWLVLAFVSFLTVWLWPVWPARALGAPAVVFLGAAMIIPPVVIAIQTGAPVRFPVMGALLVLALFISLGFDNHRVGRRAAGVAEVPVGQVNQVNLQQAYDLWRTHARVDPRDGSIPIVLVASEGGASRAGFWTGEVLSQLHVMTNGRFADSTFAISSISGGSVGAVGYAAALQDYRDAHEVLPHQVSDLTGADALSPTIAGLLFTDLLQRFLPIGFPDRAEALERSWEDAWRDSCSRRGTCDKNLIAGSFLDIWRDGDPRWTPLVIVGGASQENGRRIVTSKLALRADQVNVDDFYATTRRNIGASTAIHNGARFPYISPAGTLVENGGETHGHIVDGGYFDPAGTEVVRELAHAIRRVAGKADAARLKFIFVYIGYGESLMRQSPANPDAEVAASKAATRRAANELLSPLRALVASRDGHARHMARNLKADVSLDGQELSWFEYAAGPNEGASLAGTYVPILLCDNPGKVPEKRTFTMPMDWALSEFAMTRMRQAVQECGDNRPLLGVVVDAVNGATEAVPPREAAIAAPVPTAAPR